jgi:hypothetical protein
MPKKTLTKDEILGMAEAVETGIKYLSHPDIAEIGRHFAMPSSNVVRLLRKVSQRLKKLI